jgi:hypothetical protein
MGFEPHQADSRMGIVNEVKDWMDSTLVEARSALVKAKEYMARYYNQCHVLAPKYQVREKVFLDESDIRIVGQNVYCLRLPTSMSQLHPIFNVVKLLQVPEDPISG